MATKQVRAAPPPITVDGVNYSATYVFAMFKPDGTKYQKEVAEMLRGVGLAVDILPPVQLKLEDIMEIYPKLIGEPWFGRFVDFLTARPVPFLRIRMMDSPHAFGLLKAFLGKTDPKESEPFTIRGRFGDKNDPDLFRNVLHVPEDKQESETVESVYRRNLMIRKQQEQPSAAKPA